MSRGFVSFALVLLLVTIFIISSIIFWNYNQKAPSSNLNKLGNIEKSEEETNSDIKTIELSSNEIQELSLAIKDSLRTLNVIEIGNPNVKLPNFVHPAQIEKYFELGNIKFALVRQSSMNFFVEAPRDFTIAFTGVLVTRDNQKWYKLLEIRDVGESAYIRNNPYYMWSNDGLLYFTVVDMTGAGSGEGIMKLFESNNGVKWNLSGCYYFGFNYKDSKTSGDYFEYSKYLDEQEERPLSECTNVQLI